MEKGIRLLKEVTCPECGQKQNVTVCFKDNNSYHIRPFIYLCDNEIGGCDEYFVIRAKLSLSVTANKINRS